MLLGEKLLQQALREEGIAEIPQDNEANQALWQSVLNTSNSKSREDLLTDIGMGRQAAGWVARHFMAQLAKQGMRPNAVLLSQERFASKDRGTVTLDGKSMPRCTTPLAAALYPAMPWWPIWAVAMVCTCTMPTAPMPSACTLPMRSASSPWNGQKTPARSFMTAA